MPGNPAAFSRSRFFLSSTDMGPREKFSCIEKVGRGHIGGQFQRLLDNRQGVELELTWT
jgi:hypothetical protein